MTRTKNDEFHTLTNDRELYREIIGKLNTKRNDLYEMLTNDKYNSGCSKNEFNNTIDQIDEDNGYDLGVYQGACEALRKVKSKIDYFGVDELISDTITAVVKELTGRDC